MLDINDPAFAKQLHGIINDIVDARFDERIKSLKLEVNAKVAISSSGATVSVYMASDPTTAVVVKNPRSFSLTAGQLIAVAYPNGNENLKYIDRIL